MTNCLKNVNKVIKKVKNMSPSTKVVFSGLIILNYRNQIDEKTDRNNND